MRCQACSVRSALPCPDEGAHCAAIAAGVPGRAEQVRAVAEARVPRVEPESPAVVAPSMAVNRAILACPHKSAPGCTCNAYASCSLGKGRAGQVTWAECVECKGG